MRLVYVAGPFRADTAYGVYRNTSWALYFGSLLAEAGAMPVVPHRAEYEGVANDRLWLEGTRELLTRCDAALFVPGWRSSVGSVGEYNTALERGIPILDLDNVDDVDYAVRRFLTRTA